MTRQHRALNAAILATLAGAALACGGEDPEELGIGERESYYRRPYPDGAYVMTTFGGPGDAQDTTCGEWVDGSTFYSTGVYGWGCHAKVRVTANGRCAILEVLDNGPAAWVESRAGSRCGVARVLDVSPAAARHLFNVSGAGWSDCRMIEVERVSSSLPPGPCDASGGSVTVSTSSSPASSPAAGASCEVGSRTGVCQDTRTTSCAGSYKSGYCPGASNIKCCLPPTACQVGSQTGACLDTSSASCASGFKSGYCPGASNIKCCLD